MKKFITIGFILALLLILPIQSKTHANDQELFEEQIETFIQNELERSGTKGLTISVVQDDRTIYSNGFGFADEKANKPVTTKTVFRVGSISKVFTATAIMQLHETGRLDIDKPLIDVLPSFSIKPGPLLKEATFRDITLRHMLTHHSGIPSEYFHNNYTEIPSSPEEYASQFKDEYQAYAPGHVWSYSNSALTILGLVIEIAAGTSFHDYMEMELLSASGMNLSAFRRSDDINEELSKAYNKRGEETSYMEFSEVPAGDLYSNADDMSNFMKMILNRGLFSGNQILSEDSLEEMFRSQTDEIELDQAQNIKMGLGWFIGEDYAGKRLEHGGSTEIFHSYLQIMPEQNLGIFVSVNSVNGLGTLLRTTDFVREKSLELLRGVIKPDDPIKVRVPVPWPTENLEKYPGSYSVPNARALLKVIRHDQNLSGKLGSEIVDLVLMDDGDILFKDPSRLRTFPGISLSFETVSGSELAIFHVENNRGALALRIPQVEIPEVWSSRTGIYLNDNPGNFTWSGVLLSMEDGLLVARIFVGGIVSGFGSYHIETALIPYEDDLAYVHGLGIDGGETIHVDENDNLIVFGNRMVKTSLIKPELFDLKSNFLSILKSKSFNLMNGFFPRLN